MNTRTLKIRSKVELHVELKVIFLKKMFLLVEIRIFERNENERLSDCLNQ